MIIPEPRNLPKDAFRPLSWGLMGPGEIAHQFTSSLHRFSTQRVVGVASRSPERAAAFAKEYGIARTFSSYQELCDSPDIDAVYISTHIEGHLELARMAVRAGKHALVEKPFHYSSSAVSDLLAEAREHRVLVTEAMWTRYLPQFDVIRQILDSAEFGDVEHAHAVFAVDNRSIARLWEKDTGGIVFDMGIYPIAFAHFALGSPAEIFARGSVLANGVDRGADVRLEYESGAIASLLISGISTLPSTAAISGANQMLAIEHPFFVPSAITLNDKELYFSGSRWVDQSPVQGHDGLFYQADYFASYVAKGLVESPVHTHDEIVSNLSVAEWITRELRAAG